MREPNSYDLPDMMMPRGKRMAESQIADLEVKNARRIRAGKPPIDVIENLTLWIQKTRDPEARAHAQWELRKFQAEAEPKHPTRKVRAQCGMAIPAARPVRESGVVPRTRKDQLSELDRLWDLETT